MARGPLRWLVTNLSTLLLAFALAIVVWVSAVLSADPNETRLLSRLVPIEVIGQNPGLQLMDDPDLSVAVTLKAPLSVWTVLESDPSLVQASVDLTGLGAGEHIVPIQVQINQNLVRLVEKHPPEITIRLETLVSQIYPVVLVVRGNPPDGYQLETPTVEPADVTISGPASIVARISEVRVVIDISGANDTVTRIVTPVPVDASGKAISGLAISPDTITITQPISLLGGFRYVIVKTITIGQVANGYRLTNIYVTPVGVVVFSSDQALVDALPGYVETKPIDLTGSNDDFEVLAELNLPEGISVVGDSRVLVQVSIAAIESSLAVSLPVEIVGLTPGLQASVAPTTVDVILAGPVPELDELEPKDIRVKVDLAGYGVGTYQIIPIVDFLPDKIYKVSILPATVEVTITLAPSPTPTPTPLVTPTASPTPTPTVTPTSRP